MDDATRTATSHARNGAFGDAVRIHLDHGNVRCAATLLADRGDEVLAALGPRALLDVLDTVPGLTSLRRRALAVAGEAVDHAERLLAAGRCGQALAAADKAVGLAGDDRTRGRALTCGGRALGLLGRHDEAVGRLERAIALCEHAQAWSALGDVQRSRGRDGSARAAYRTAMRLDGAHAPAMSGLALLDADPDLAARACELATGPALTRALLAKARLNQDSDLARQAAAMAGHDDPLGLAEALELLADGTPRKNLTEALALCHAADARWDVLRLTVRIGALPGASTADKVRARVARDELGMPADRSGVVIRTLGRFDVLVDGEPLPAQAWQSRKARDLLRILVARRGRGIAREELAALLWDDDSGKVHHRLSVALSTVRAVLDPHKRLPADHHVLAGPGSVALDLDHVRVDLEEFHADAAHGLRRRDVEALTRAEHTYAGDFFEDEPYDAWADATREEARATHLRVLRTLVACHNGDTDAVVRHLHRMLATDPHDEQAHRDLIDALSVAGCHGEAERARRRYTEAISALT